MTKGLFGTKLFMAQLFQTDGKLLPVTYLQLGPNLVSQVKTVANDGYQALQVVAAFQTRQLNKKTQRGHLKALNPQKGAVLRELRTTLALPVGTKLPSDLLQPGTFVDVIAVSKGKGTAGVIKRHNFGRGPMSHGSKHHRAPGSVGLSRPDKIWKGQPLPGRKGHQQTTVRNLQVVAFYETEQILALKGSVPGAFKTLVKIRSAKHPPRSLGSVPTLFRVPDSAPRKETS